MKPAPRTFALIPAGGRSQRMGHPKLALPLGERTVLEHVIVALRQAGIADIVVVIAPHAAALLPLAQAAGAEVCTLPEETPDMRATVEHGLKYIEERFHPDPDDDWLLVPADHPTLDATVVRQLRTARQTHPGKSIVVPSFEGRRGHPTLIGWRHVAAMRSFSPGQGLNAYLRRQQAEMLELTVSVATILDDLDTPADYERLCRGRSAPTRPDG
jgi:molybdenum cofactor cytidylyltransferase